MDRAGADPAGELHLVYLLADGDDQHEQQHRAGDDEQTLIGQALVQANVSTPAAAVNSAPITTPSSTTLEP